MTARTRRYPTGDELLAMAMQESGLTDFGPGDFRDGLDNLLASLERDGDLDPAADSRVIDDFLRRLVNRLEVEAWYRSHPEQLRVLHGCVEVVQVQGLDFGGQLLVGFRGRNPSRIVGFALNCGWRTRTGLFPSTQTTELRIKRHHVGQRCRAGAGQPVDVDRS